MARETEEPLVSIVVPTFNRASLVGRALESLLSQTHQSLQIIVVNNGSTDDTAEVLARYAAQPRVTIVTLPVNGRVYKAYNVGLERVRGRYTTFLYDDDAFMPDAIEVLVRKAEELGPRVGMVFGNCVDPEANVETGTGIDRERVVRFADAMSGNIRGEYSGIWRTEALGARRFEEELEGAESLVWYDMYRHFDGYYIGRPVRYYYRFRHDSISRPRFDLASARRRARTYERHLEMFGGDMLRICPRQYVNCLRNAALWSILAGERSTAAVRLLEGCRASPSLRTFALLGMAVLPSGALEAAVRLRYRAMS